VFTLDVPGLDENPMVICKDQHIHPITRVIEHVDFFKIEDDYLLELYVPIKVTGRSQGEKLGGKLTVIRNVVKVKCIPSAIPVFIEVSVDDLAPGGSILIGEVPFPEGVTPVIKSNFAVVAVTNPTATATDTGEEEEKEAAALAAV
jgi:large subunit ribosomal protein L25